MTQLFHPVREEGSLSGRIVAQIERLIEERNLQPGDRLPPERELAGMLGVSRPSLREAVKTLEANRRVAVKHGTGVWILPPNPMRHLAGIFEVNLRDLFAMREVLEVPAAGWAAECKEDAAVSRLLGVLDAMEPSVNIDELRRLDVEFHIRIAEMARNRFLLGTMDVLHEMLRLGMETTLAIPGRIPRSRLEHRRIANAIAAGDANRARRMMRAHIRSAQAAGLRRLANEEPEYRSLL